MTPRRLLLLITFLYFADDTGTTYGDWFAPFGWTHYVLFESLPDKIRPFDHLVALCLFLGLQAADGKGRRVPAMRNTLLLSVGSIVLLFVYGLYKGGDFVSASWQVYLLLSGVLFAFTVATLFKTPEHFAQLAKVILAVAAYRALMCWIYYLLFIFGSTMAKPPEFLTTHDDTVLWVVSILVLFLNMVQTDGFVKRLKPALFALFLVGAILFNQRRLAWVSLAMGLAILIGVMPRGKAKKRVMRGFLVLAPILAIYVAVGWGQTSRVFKPLQSFATVSTKEDASTKARDAENLGLIATSNYSSLMLGTGWGHKYVEVTNHFSIAAIFPMWQYIPHNSILGLLAYSGVLGFSGYWLMFPTAMFLNARVARLGNTPLARNVGLVGAAQLVVCANQYYGDMGLTFLKPVYMAAISYAIALRTPILSGALASPGKAGRIAPARTPSPATDRAA